MTSTTSTTDKREEDSAIVGVGRVVKHVILHKVTQEVFNEDTFEQILEGDEKDTRGTNISGKGNY